MSTSLHAQFANDTELEVDKGIDIDYGAGGIITIRRAGGANKDFDRVFAHKARPHQRQIRDGRLDEELARLAIHGFLHIAGWEHPSGEERLGSPMFLRQEALLRTVLDAAE